MSLNKHFFNAPDTLVIDALNGLCAINPQLAFDSSNKVVHNASLNRSKVALICGGGSGHEPAHSGFVGDGMLSAAVCGNVFASPSASQVCRAIDLVDNDKGTVIIVKNYTGDVLNFGLAKEQYAAQHPDKTDRVKFVIVGDDVSVGRTQGSLVGRRGLAGTVLVYKIAGALAQRGATLDEVNDIAQWVSSRIGTIGVGLEHCHIPGTGSSESHLFVNEIEIGMGIHNEPGHSRRSPVPPLDELVAYLLKLLTSTTDPERSFLPFRGNNEDLVVLLVNNLGGVSELEMSGIVGQVLISLREQGVFVHRVLSGTFMTSLNMPGFSITLLLLPYANETTSPSLQLLLSLLDDPTSTPGWKWSSGAPPPANPIASIPTSDPASATTQLWRKLSALDSSLFTASIESACNALIDAEPEITRMDSIAGDGDCGLTLKAGATAVLVGLRNKDITGDDVVGAAMFIASVAEKNMGGTSGALYSIFFSALAQGLQEDASNKRSATEDTWAHALSLALTKLYTYTLARPPSRTLVDPLAAFISRLPEVGFASAVQEAGTVALATRDIDAKAGRSAYAESEKLREERVPDPGAWGIKVILEGFQQALERI